MNSSLLLHRKANSLLSEKEGPSESNDESDERIPEHHQSDKDRLIAAVSDVPRKVSMAEALRKAERKYGYEDEDIRRTLNVDQPLMEVGFRDRRYVLYWMVRGVIAITLFLVMFHLYYEYIFRPLFQSEGSAFESREDVERAARRVLAGISQAAPQPKRGRAHF